MRSARTVYRDLMRSALAAGSLPSHATSARPRWRPCREWRGRRTLANVKFPRRSRRAGGGLGPSEIECGGHEADMAERLGKIAEHPARAGIVLLGEKPDVVSLAEQVFEKRPGFGEAALERVVVGKP